MKIRIRGEEFVVRKTTAAIDAWQRQSGHGLPWLKDANNQVFGVAFTAFCALFAAGRNPSWEALVNDYDIDEFQAITEPGDQQAEVDASVPPSPPAASAPADGAEREPAQESSTLSS